MIDKSVILEGYLRRALSGINGVSYQKEHFNFRCNICGDGEKRKNKRGHLKLIRSKKTFELFWYYKCWNEGCPAEQKSWSGENWLKHTSPELYRQYLAETLSPSNSNIKKIKERNKKQQKIEEELKRKANIKREKAAVKYFLPLSSKNKEYENLLNHASTFCINRKIPEYVWKTWFVSYNGLYKNRLIIPFYNNNKIYYYQARSLFGQDPKYLNRNQNKDKAVYNMYALDLTRPIIVLEGIIDSLFVENSVAMIGLSYSKYTENYFKNSELHYWLDNDATGKRTSKKLLEQGKSVFLWNKWNKFSECKDVNEIVIKYDINTFTYKNLKNFFTNNLYDSLYLEM